MEFVGSRYCVCTLYFYAHISEIAMRLFARLLPAEEDCCKNLSFYLEGTSVLSSVHHIYPKIEKCYDN